MSPQGYDLYTEYSVLFWELFLNHTHQPYHRADILKNHTHDQRKQRPDFR